MPAEKPSVLQQIRKREVELSVRTDQARRDAEQMVADARREAAVILKNAEADGSRTAEEYRKEKLASALEKVDSLHKSSEAEVKAARLKGEQNMSKAVNKILHVVISG
ncbi:MAG: V-type ATPase subunit subunit G family protein [Halobacteriota archaeon]